MMHYEKLVRGFGAALVLGNAAIGASCDSEPTTCLSPPALSKVYKGDQTPKVHDQDPGTRRLGLLATTTQLPRDEGYQGLVVSFKDPNNAKDGWHASQPVSSLFDRDKQVVLAVGEGDVAFSTQIQAAADSPDCAAAPLTSFGTLGLLTGKRFKDMIEPMWPGLPSVG